MVSSKESMDCPVESPPLPNNPYKDPDDGRQRFLLELEFVQCLANPTYIHCSGISLGFWNPGLGSAETKPSRTVLLRCLRNPLTGSATSLGFRNPWLGYAESSRAVLLRHLHNPLADLAQNRYFEDEAFIGYLKYLQYWQRPEYIKFIMYPHCLFFLELLQNANFRNAMAHPGSKELAHRQQYFFWKNYRNNRLKHILPRPLPEPAAPPVPPPPVPASVPAHPQAPPASLPPMTTAGGSTLSPMQFMGAPSSNLPKADMRNTMGDRRKRKKLEELEHGFLRIPRNSS
ncbi:Mediator of RNA polymerase II transcription subunit 31 [Ananas comosus]|uniref:Mediator of RNA polymerase II transcription subunit 31 n=1 Tax=Ananas comosus TaxID=4615 RepID=A0A199VSL2_ANACO|nr:Mediator of RNA polymerase II transcription subunit 31 [Ananas comosus]